MGCPAISDLDGNGKPEIVFGDASGNLTVIEVGRMGRPVLKWRFSTRPSAFGILGSPMIADLDGDGTKEVVFGAGDHYLYCVSPEGKLVWEMQLPDTIYSTPTLIPSVKYSGMYDLLVTSSMGEMGNKTWLLAQRITFYWEVLWSIPVKIHSIPSFDVDGDGDYEILLTRGDVKAGRPSDYYFKVVRGNGSALLYLLNPPGLNNTFPGRVSIVYDSGSFMIVAGSNDGILYCWEIGEGLGAGGESVNGDEKNHTSIGHDETGNETSGGEMEADESGGGFLWIAVPVAMLILFSVAMYRKRGSRR